MLYTYIHTSYQPLDSSVVVLSTGNRVQEEVYRYLVFISTGIYIISFYLSFRYTGGGGVFEINYRILVFQKQILETKDKRQKA